MSRPMVLLALQFAAFWSVWSWAIGRISSSGEVGWEMLPLATAALLSWGVGKEHEVPQSALLLAAALAFAYTTAFIFAPPLFRAVLAVASITVLVSSWRFGTIFHPGLFALTLLSLPITDSLNFFLGYPMRVLVGEAVEFLLLMQGLDVYREGVGLHFNEAIIWIDAPCSGIQMLWFGVFLTVTISMLLKIGPLRFGVALGLGLGAIIAGNILRAAALFYVESGLIEAPQWMHSAVGVTAFALTSLSIVVLVGKVASFRWQK